MTDVENASQSRRCAVIYNPTKISDKFRALGRRRRSAKRLGLGRMRDPYASPGSQGGAGVIAAGGDGTIRAVAAAACRISRSYLQADAAQLPFRPATFDALLCVAAHHTNCSALAPARISCCTSGIHGGLPD